MEDRETYDMKTHPLVLCRSDEGDGGWSLHAPGSSDKDIATGAAPYLVDGTSDLDIYGLWSRPDAYDYRAAWGMLAERDRAKLREVR